MRRLAICFAVLLPSIANAEYPAFRLRDQSNKIVSTADQMLQEALNMLR